MTPTTPTPRPTQAETASEEAARFDAAIATGIKKHRFKYMPHVLVVVGMLIVLFFVLKTLAVATETVQIALIATIVPTVTVVLTWMQTRSKVSEVHQVVNSQRTRMEESIAALETEIRRLNLDPEQGITPRTRDQPLAPVTISKQGTIKIEHPDVMLNPQVDPNKTK